MTPTEQKRYVPIDPVLLAPTNHARPALLPPPIVPVDALPPTLPSDPVPAKPTSQGKERGVGVDMLSSTRHPSQMAAVLT